MIPGQKVYRVELMPGGKYVICEYEFAGYNDCRQEKLKDTTGHVRLSMPGETVYPTLLAAKRGWGKKVREKLAEAEQRLADAEKAVNVLRACLEEGPQ